LIWKKHDLSEGDHLSNGFVLLVCVFVYFVVNLTYENGYTCFYELFIITLNF